MDDHRLDALKDRLLRQGRPSLVPRALGGGVAEQSSLLRLRPFAEAVFLVVASDGHIDEREADVLRGVLRALTDGQLGGAALQALVADFQLALEREGIEARLDSLAAALYADRDDAELAVALALAAALANGHIVSSEGDVIHGLAERLRVPIAKKIDLRHPER